MCVALVKCGGGVAAYRYAPEIRKSYFYVLVDEVDEEENISN